MGYLLLVYGLLVVQDGPLKSVDEIQKCNHLGGSYQAILSVLLFVLISSKNIAI